jgi:hypothetical protein
MNTNGLLMTNEQGKHSWALNCGRPRSISSVSSVLARVSMSGTRSPYSRLDSKHLTSVPGIALLFSGAVTLNVLGLIIVVAQAIPTGVFAELQYIGLRKSGGVVTA